MNKSYIGIIIATIVFMMVGAQLSSAEEATSIPSASPSPSASASIEPSSTPSPIPTTVTPSPTPITTPTASVVVSPTAEPTSLPVVTVAPSATPDPYIYPGDCVQEIVSVKEIRPVIVNGEIIDNEIVYETEKFTPPAIRCVLEYVPFYVKRIDAPEYRTLVKTTSIKKDYFPEIKRIDLNSVQYVPAKEVLIKAGLKVKWDNVNKKIIGYNDKYKVEIKKDSGFAIFKNKTKKKMGYSAKLLKGQLIIPLNFAIKEYGK